MEALRFVNRIRRKHGKGGLKKLRKGYRRSLCNCPISRSLNDLPGILEVQTGAGKVIVIKQLGETMRTVINYPLEGKVADFVHKYDNYYYSYHPELVL